MTITRAEYDALMATRTRPLTDPHMSNAKANQARLDAAGIDPTDDTVDTLVALIADRKRRRTERQTLGVPNSRKKDA